MIAAKIEPQNAAKNPMAITIAIPSPPGKCPTKEVAKFTNLVAAPPRSITIPENTNNGTAISTCLFIDSKAIWISVDHGKFKPQIAAIELPNPKTKKIGTDKNNKKNEKITANENIKEIGLYKFQLKLLKVALMKINPL